MDIRDRIRSFIKQNYFVPDGSPLPDDASLLEQGIVDSTGVLEIIAFIERTFQITVHDAELVPDNLDSIERISAFVAKKQQQQQQQQFAVST